MCKPYKISIRYLFFSLLKKFSDNLETQGQVKAQTQKRKPRNKRAETTLTHALKQQKQCDGERVTLSTKPLEYLDMHVPKVSVGTDALPFSNINAMNVCSKYKIEN